MAFCTKCGKELAEGEVCNCSVSDQQVEQEPVAVAQTQGESQQQAGSPAETAVQPVAQQPAAPVVQPVAEQPAPNVVVIKAPSPVSNFFVGLWDEIKGFVKAPVSQTKTALEGKNFAGGLILLAANAIISLLVTLCMLKDAPFGIVMRGFLLPVLLYFAFCGVIAIFAAVTKVKCNFPGIMSAMGLITIPLSALGVANIILSLVSVTLGLGISIISLMIWAVFAYEVGRDVMSGAKNEKAAVIFMAVIGLAVAIVLWIVSGMAVFLLKSMVLSSLGGLF